ncbi:hypothetical protein [Brevundimonas vesicularis]|uniref:hypothetical protein n=1 Tax=Brevundimonas vesicularis TaxID=41276 RepID=UPI00384D55CC
MGAASARGLFRATGKASKPVAVRSGVDLAAAFIPVEGQSFSCEQDWINRATRALTRHPQYRNTEHGETKGWRGPHFTALCFDQAGNRMRNGGDFKRAANEATYPVWWIWPDQIEPLLRAQSEARV